MINKNKSLIFNLFLIFVIFYLVHSFYLFMVILIYKMHIGIFYLNLLISLVYDGTILTGLLFLRDKFVFAETGVPLKKLNLANVISLFRITALPVIFILLLYVQDYPILKFVFPYIFIVFLSDFVDGIIARSYHQITQIGKYIDSASDYLILIAISTIFTIYHLIPVWFFILVIIRLLTFPLGMIFISIMRKELVYEISFLGKVSIFLIMFLYAFELVATAGIEVMTLIKPYLEYAIGAVVIISLAEKVISLIKTSKQIKLEK